jgi:hypothetical protein
MNGAPSSSGPTTTSKSAPLALFDFRLGRSTHGVESGRPINFLTRRTALLVASRSQ